MELTLQEKEIIETLRELKPYEEIKVFKDQLGRPDHYLVVRTQKVILSKEQKQYIRLD